MKRNHTQVRTKVLIIEDKKDVALSIKNILEGLDYTVIATIASGVAAMQIISESPPDLVLIDLKLKGSTDGIEAAAQIRRRFQIPVVYLTDYTDDQTSELVKLTEPSGYIFNPFEARDLCTTIEFSLYKHQIEQQLREREQWLTMTLKSIGDAVITIDSEGLITFMNSVAETLTCWKQEEALGQELNQVFQTINEKTRQAVESPAAVVLRKDVNVTLKNNAILITKDGNEIPIDNSAAPIKNEGGKVLGAVLVFHDVIKQQDFQESLKKTNEELENRVAENTAQLRKENEQLQAEIVQGKFLEKELLFALEKARELNELKSSSLAAISHEYRTPLTTILSSTEMLEQYSSQWTEERKQKHFQRIKFAVKHLTNLVNDVLLVNQSELGRLEFNPVPLDVEQVARKLVEEFKLNTPSQHTIIFECQGTSTNAFLDEKLLQSMLRNLLANAIKYSPQGSLIQLELVFQKNTVVFRISDQGIGIPPADQDKLFTAFLRGSNVGITPGVGLGLAIVKECVNLHGGKIVVESEVRVGTRFTITFPLVQKLNYSD